MTQETLQKELQSWFAGKIGDRWFTGPLEVDADSEEILVVGHLPEPKAKKTEAKAEKTSKDASPEQGTAHAVSEFRESTRADRMEIAAEAERLFNRKVSWGVRAEDRLHLFTGLAIPVMTRLRIKERSLLDTLVASGVARSRSDALSWCARLVAKHQADWINDLKQAFEHVEKVRAEGPSD